MDGINDVMWIITGEDEPAVVLELFDERTERFLGVLGEVVRFVEEDDLRAVPYKRTSGWSSKASGGVERRRGRALKARGERRETPGKVLKERRSSRERGRMGTSV